MFDDDIYYDYDSIVNDSDPLYEDDEYDYELDNEHEFDYYYHNITDELIDD